MYQRLQPHAPDLQPLRNPASPHRSAFRPRRCCWSASAPPLQALRCPLTLPPRGCASACGEDEHLEARHIELQARYTGSQPPLHMIAGSPSRPTARSLNGRRSAARGRRRRARARRWWLRRLHGRVWKWRSTAARCAPGRWPRSSPTAAAASLRGGWWPSCLLARGSLRGGSSACASWCCSRCVTGSHCMYLYTRITNTLHVLIHGIHTACTLHVHCMCIHTACTLHVHCMCINTACTL